MQTNTVTADIDLRSAAPLVRELPSFGVLALLVDGAGPTQIAAALDVPTAIIRQHAATAVLSLMNRGGMLNPDVGEIVSRSSLWKVAQCLNKLTLVDGRVVSWLDVVTDVEFLEIVEMRAYFRAFRNSKPT